MKSIDNVFNAVFCNFYHLTPWLLRLGLGISFFFHGYGKAPFTPSNTVLIDKLGFSSELAYFVAISELGAGILLILGGFLKGHVGNLVTRFAAGVIVIVMIFAFTIAHSDWFITPKLFMSEQIFLIIIGLYFFIKGNN